MCRKGDIGKEMYIIKKGKFEVCLEDGKVVFVIFEEGVIFGEISIFNFFGNKIGNRRIVSVRSVGFFDFFCLSKIDLFDVLSEYFEVRKSLIEIGKNILRKDNLLDEEVVRREERR